MSYSFHPSTHLSSRTPNQSHHFSPSPHSIAHTSSLCSNIIPTTPPNPNPTHAFSPAAPISPPPPPLNSHPMITRAKEGIFKPKLWLSQCTTSSISEPRSYKTAIADPNWKQANLTEYEALIQKKTWSLVSPPPDCKVVGCRWVFRVKLKLSGEIESYKSRLVAQGFTQAHDIDYFETFSPVIKPTTIQIVLSLVVNFNWRVRQLDIRNAFLNGDLNEEVYMKQPLSFVDSAHPSHVLKLHKVLYGLKQSPQAWFLKLSSCLLNLGFFASKSDTSMFIYRDSSSIVVFLIYVDDILVTGNDFKLIQHFISSLGSLFMVKDIGDLSYFLGIQVARDD